MVAAKRSYFKTCKMFFGKAASVPATNFIGRCHSIFVPNDRNGMFIPKREVLVLGSREVTVIGTRFASSCGEHTGQP